MASASATTSSDPIADRFAALASAGRKALVVYVTAGHPDRASSVALLRALAAAGADVIELGVPFSDPLADGPVIQRSSQVAIAQGMNFEGALAIAAEAAVDVPLVLFSYLNPVMAAGPEALTRARAAGIAGLLITDLPVGADRAREAAFGAGPLAFVRLVAPTTPVARMAEIARHGRGFVYCISRTGVTGEQANVAADLPATVARLREATTLPICVGFGISSAAQARAVAELADGVVIGSAVVRLAEQSIDAAAAFVAEVRRALDAA
ncbi:MAG: tryptophan synthase subunit alpha [Gemmatimonadaceae bacterium]|nr:tryptophan synthase subunit alpha [Gemmatimonadaceae bacterium]